MTPELVFTAGIIVVTYAAISNRLFAFGRGYRSEFEGYAELLLDDDRLSVPRRKMFMGITDGIITARTAWKLCGLLVGVFFRNLFLAGRAPQSETPSSAEAVPPDLAEKWHKMERAAVLSVLCTSPAALAAFGLMMAFASFIRPATTLVDQTLTEAAASSAEDDRFYPPRRAA